MTSDMNDGPAASYISKALLHNATLGNKHPSLVAAAGALSERTVGRKGLLKLIQVIAMSPDKPELGKRPMPTLIADLLADKGVLGLPDGIEAHRIVAAAVVAEEGGVDGCPIWDSSMLQKLPALPETDRTSDDEPEAPSGKVSKQVALPKDEAWKTDTAQLANLVKTILDFHNQLSSRVDELGKYLVAARKAEVAALRRDAWETNSVWWSQAAYSKARETPYRVLEKKERLFWMAFDLADVSPPFRHPGLESFFVETLRRWKLTDSLDKDVSAEERVRSLLTLSEPPTFGEELVEIVESDATALPVTWLLRSHGKDVNTTLGKLAEATQTTADAGSLAVWAAQLLRELQLDRWLQEEDEE